MGPCPRRLLNIPKTIPMQIFQNERHRLNERIRSIQDKVTKRELAKYRTRISKPSEVAKRGVGEIIDKWNGKTFFEAADLLPLLHKWLDERNIPTHPPIKNTSSYDE